MAVERVGDEMTASRSDPTSTRWRAAPRGSAWRVRTAWIATVVVSAVPAIVLSVSGLDLPWLSVGQLALAALLVIVSTLVRPIRPLWRYGVALFALVGLSAILPTVRVEIPVVQAILGGTAFNVRMQPEQSGKILAAAAMVVVLLLLGCGRRGGLLRVGDLAAPIRPVRWLGFSRPDPWWRFGLIWGFGIAAALGVAQYLVLRPTVEQFVNVVPLLPAVICFAAINAVSEELIYRVPVLATLESAVGSSQALWQSAFLFGVAHYFGIPGGAVGAVLSIFMGWILGKAMLETRGLFWAWFIHFLSDVVIFAYLAMATF